MKYQDVIYKHYKKSSYPSILSEYLTQKYFRTLVEIADLGCGDGTYVREFDSLGHYSIGFDYNKTVMSCGIEIESQLDLSKDKIPAQDESFDVVFTKSTIEHMNDPFHFLKEARRILKPGGTIIVLTPSWEDNYRWFYDDPTHIRPFHRKGLKDALRLCDFKDVTVEYFYHLEFTWKHPYLVPLMKLVMKLVPDAWRWKDKEQTQHNVFIRFAKESQLLAVAKK